MPQTPGRFKSGVNTSPVGTLFGDYQWPGPVDLYEYKNDFSTYAAGDWTVTSTNSGTSALTDGAGGLLLQTTGGTSTNYQANQLAKKSFYLASGYRSWFWINFNLSDTAHTLLIAGLVDTLAGPMTPSKGVYFTKTDASTTLSLVMKGAGTTTITVGTIAAATAYTVGWYYDGRSSPTLYVFSTIGQSLPVMQQGFQVYGGTNVVAAAGANSSAGNTLDNFPAVTDGLTLGFGITTGASAAHTNTVDYVGAAAQINRF